MPPGFSVLDALLTAVPVLLMLLGLIRGAPVELASCCGCLAGIAVAWAASCLGQVQALGQPWAPLLSLGAGIAAWRLTRGLSRRLGFDTRWVDLGRVLDSAIGGAMGALRGMAMVSAGCLAYAVVLVPLGFSDPAETLAYPVFLSLGSQVTSAALARAQPAATMLASTNVPDSLASVPLPFIAPHIGPAPTPAPMPAAPVVAAVPATGSGLAALVQTIAPPAAAAPLRPMPAYHPDIPVRGIPASLIETHHNILHPFGSAGRRRRH